MAEAEAPNEKPQVPDSEQSGTAPPLRPVEPPTAADPELEHITEPGREPREGKFFP